MKVGMNWINIVRTEDYMLNRRRLNDQAVPGIVLTQMFLNVWKYSNVRARSLDRVRVPKKVVLKKEKDAGGFRRVFQIVNIITAKGHKECLHERVHFTEHTLLHQYKVLPVPFSNHSCHTRSVSDWCAHYGILDRYYVLQGGGMSIPTWATAVRKLYLQWAHHAGVQ